MAADRVRSSKIKIGLWLDEIKAEIKAELDQEGAKSPHLRLKLAMQGAQRHAASDDSKDQLRCFVYLVSALFHHERHGGLTMVQINRLAELGYVALRLLGIPPYSSRLSMLYSDLHLALSQCYRRSGRHWKAAWEQQMSMQLLDKSHGGANIFQEMALATRTLRLGYSDIARDRFLSVEQATQLPQLFEKARLGRVRAARLSGDRTTAMALIKDTLTRTELSAPFLREVAWEEICCLCSQTGDLAPMVAAVQRGGSHYHVGFICEATLWSYGVSNRTWIERLPSLKTVVSNPQRRLKHLGFIYTAARQLVACSDSEQPTATRLRDLGDVLERVNQLLTVDRELLLWVAAARWLARIKSFTLAEFALRKYVALSLDLSSGYSRDVLGHAPDLFERAWYKGGPKSA